MKKGPKIKKYRFAILFLLYSIYSPKKYGAIYQRRGLMENGNFKHYDAGLPVDYELDSSSWYDLTKLDTAIAGFAK